jgi:D-aminopeptidase
MKNCFRATRKSDVFVTDDAMSPLFEAVIEATEGAIYNSVFRVTTVTVVGHRVEALLLDKTIDILRGH